MTPRKPELLVIIITAGLAVVAGPWMPAQLPWHFDAVGRPDLWASKYLALAMAPLALLLFVVFGRYWSRNAPWRRGIVLWAFVFAQVSVTCLGLGLGRWSLAPLLAYGAAVFLRRGKVW